MVTAQPSLSRGSAHLTFLFAILSSLLFVLAWLVMVALMEDDERFPALVETPQQQGSDHAFHTFEPRD